MALLDEEVVSVKSRLGLNELTVFTLSSDEAGTLDAMIGTPNRFKLAVRLPETAEPARPTGS